MCNYYFFLITKSPCHDLRQQSFIQQHGKPQISCNPSNFEEGHSTTLLFVEAYSQVSMIESRAKMLATEQYHLFLVALLSVVSESQSGKNNLEHAECI